jgi:MYXO-CTERM domain-containing protein
MQREPLRVLKIVRPLALALAFMTGAYGTAQAHTLWMMPAPRDNMDGYKPTRTAGFVQPCGVVRRPTQPITNLTAGAMQMVTWKETTPHPGCFLIEFAMSDAGPFQRLTVEPHPADITPNRNYMKMIQLPNMECTGCILRIRQYMVNSNPCPPVNLNDNSGDLYYSCANINLRAGGGDGGAPADAGRDAGGADTRSGTGGTGGGGGGGGAGGGTGGGGGAGGSGGGSGGTPGYGGSSGGGGTSTGGTSGSGTGGEGGGTTPPPRRRETGGCAVGGTGSGGGLLLILALALVRRRRR